MNTQVIDALRRIRALRKYPTSPQSKIAEDRILRTLNVSQFEAVVTALEQDADKAAQ